MPPNYCILLTIFFSQNEENLEATLISIAKRRHKDPKGRRRGLVASTMPCRAESDDDEGMALIIDVE